MKALTKTILSLFVVLVLAGLSLIGITDINPFNQRPPDSTAISITIIILDEPGNVLLSEEIQVEGGSLEEALTILDQANENISFSLKESEMGSFYESFTVAGTTYGGGTTYVLLYCNDPEYSTNEWGASIILGDETYDSATVGASMLYLKKGMKYLLTVVTW